MKHKESIIIIVGSENPAKLRGIKKAFSIFFNNIELKSAIVNNEVGPQPFGFEEIFKGAECRALNALKINKSVDYSVGLEAGIVQLYNTYFILQVSCILTPFGNTYYGISPGFEVPRVIIKPILEGEFGELEDAVESITNMGQVGEKEGLIGIMSKGLVKREDLSYYATLMALIKMFHRSLVE